MLLGVAVLCGDSPLGPRPPHHRKGCKQTDPMVMTRISIGLVGGLKRARIVSPEQGRVVTLSRKRLALAVASTGHDGTAGPWQKSCSKARLQRGNLLICQGRKKKCKNEFNKIVDGGTFFLKEEKSSCKLQHKQSVCES